MKERPALIEGDRVEDNRLELGRVHQEVRDESRPALRAPGEVGVL